MHPTSKPLPIPLSWSAPGAPEHEALLEAMGLLPIAVVLLEAGAGGPPVVLAWNEAYDRFIGAELPEGANVAALPFELFRPDRVTRVAVNDLPGVRAALTGEPVTGFEGHMRRLDGSWRVSSVSAAPVSPAPGSARRRAVVVLLDRTEAHRAEAQRRRFEALAARSRDGLFLLRQSDAHVLEVNEAATQIYGYTREEFLRLSAHDLRVNAPDDDAEVARRLRLIGPHGTLLLATHVRRDGTPFPVETSARSEVLDGQPVIVAAVRDISERLALETRARLAHRALVTLTRCNEALVRATTEEELLQSICNIVVEDGGQRMCWVGWLEDDERKSIRPVAWAGHEDGYLEHIRPSWADVPEGRGPTGRAARTGVPVVVGDVAADPILAPWRDQNLARGYRSGMSVPLVWQGRVFGVLSLYAAEPNAITGEVRDLMVQLGADLAYGLAALRARAERDRSREELRALAARLDAIREEEKARIARDLHDDMGQLLTGLRIMLDQIEEAASALPPDRTSGGLVDRVVDASNLAGRAITAMRQAVARLRPAALDRLGLVPALRQECRAFQDRTRIACQLTAPEELALGADAELALFRIAQEALTNVARHAAARRVELTLEVAAGAVQLRVADDGRGLPPAGPRPRGLGLIGMRERAERLGGELKLTQREPSGTVVTTRLPLSPPLPGACP